MYEFVCVRTCAFFCCCIVLQHRLHNFVYWVGQVRHLVRFVRFNVDDFWYNEHTIEKINTILPSEIVYCKYSDNITLAFNKTALHLPTVEKDKFDSVWLNKLALSFGLKYEQIFYMWVPFGITLALVLIN